MMMIRAWSIDSRKTKDEVCARQSRENIPNQGGDLSTDLSSLLVRRTCAQHPFRKRLSLRATEDQKGCLSAIREPRGIFYKRADAKWRIYPAFGVTKIKRIIDVTREPNSQKTRKERERTTTRPAFVIRPSLFAASR